MQKQNNNEIFRTWEKSFCVRSHLKQIIRLKYGRVIFSACHRRASNSRVWLHFEANQVHWIGKEKRPDGRADPCKEIMCTKCFQCSCFLFPLLVLFLLQGNNHSGIMFCVLFCCVVFAVQIDLHARVCVCVCSFLFSFPKSCVITWLRIWTKCLCCFGEPRSFRRLQFAFRSCCRLCCCCCCCDVALFGSVLVLLSDSSCGSL